MGRRTGTVLCEGDLALETPMKLDQAEPCNERAIRFTYGGETHMSCLKLGPPKGL